MVPVLGDVKRALWHPGAARVDGRQAGVGTARRGRRTSASKCATGAVDDVAAHAAIVDGVEIAADAVVIAGGAWSRALGDRLGVALPVGPVRGQIVHLGVAGHDTGAWPIVQPVFGYYMVPWADARVAVGATVEDAGFDPAVTAGGVHEVLRETLRVMPGLATGDVARGAGRPPPGERRRHADHRARSRVTTNVIVATGHGANGLLLGPVTGALVADLVRGTAPPIDLAPFSPARFG